ncbi:MAG: efflux RND transporter periplasmic adaptor subunit [Chitinophagaceae bacterium]|jgi:HlyD family secretion protein|nr:efflux RND transporter periplasmic adaptor subunit [Chitinophagaceae bacterium]
MSKKVKWILISLGVLIVLLIGGKMIFGKDDDGIKVTTETVTNRTIIETVNASGKIYPEIEVKISPDISGEITELNVQEGDSVKKGQILARIYADIYALQRDEASSRVNQSQATVANSNAALQALDANLNQARQAYERNKKLYDDKVISKAELEQFETTYLSAQANYNAAKQNIRSLQAGVQSAQTGLVSANKNLGRTTLVAPMDGVISLLAVKEGERVVGTAQMAGTEMMRVADMSLLEVRVEVGENDVVKVNLGDSADVEVDAYNNRKFKGIVTKIASSTKGASSAASANDVTNYEVSIRLDPASYKDLYDPSKPKKFPFRPGMNASADIKTTRHENVLAVPINAVTTRVRGSDKTAEDQKSEAKKESPEEEETENSNSLHDDELEEVVFVLNNDGTIKKSVVTTSIQDINYIEITTGLKSGEKIITGPYNVVSKTLKEGSKVKVVEKDKLFE